MCPWVLPSLHTVTQYQIEHAQVRKGKIRLLTNLRQKHDFAGGSRYANSVSSDYLAKGKQARQSFWYRSLDWVIMRSKMSEESALSKPMSIAILAAIYVATIAGSILLGGMLPVESPLVKVAIVDLGATLVIFVCSVLCNNSSVYDPYWSVAPPVFVGYWIFRDGDFAAIGLGNWVLLGLLLLWSCRLTLNFLRGWRGLHHEDWRYADFRAKTPKLYWLVSLFGFHLVPSLVVFLASVPIYYGVSHNSGSMGLLHSTGALLVLAAIVIEAIADQQLRHHLLSGADSGTSLRMGLWAYSRHPNYFGEILLWWGVFVFGLGTSTDAWWTVFGPLVMTALFVFISLPLIEKRMRSRRSDYAEVKKSVSILVPWFPKEP